MTSNLPNRILEKLHEHEMLISGLVRRREELAIEIGRDAFMELSNALGSPWAGVRPPDRKMFGYDLEIMDDLGGKFNIVDRFPVRLEGVL